MTVMRLPAIVTAFTGARPIHQALLTADDLAQIVDALELAQSTIIQTLDNSSICPDAHIVDLLRIKATVWYDLRHKIDAYIKR